MFAVFNLVNLGTLLAFNQQLLAHAHTHSHAHADAHAHAHTHAHTHAQAAALAAHCQQHSTPTPADFGQAPATGAFERACRAVAAT